jgi:hypothetical protein
MIKIMFILQNGYHSTKYKYRNLQEWSEDLQRSHTGKRLAQMIPEHCEYHVINSTPEIGNSAASCLKPQKEYVLDWIKTIKPEIICACGRTAQAVCNDLRLDYISVPHPAWRRLSQFDTSTIKAILARKINELESEES